MGVPLHVACESHLAFQACLTFLLTQVKFVKHCCSAHAKNADLPMMGETQGLARVEYFLKHHGHPEARILMMSQNSRAHITFGCLFHRAAFHNVGWLTAHLPIRDFFLFLCLASGFQFFAAHGRQTGFPFVDAAMREIQQTGYCSNRVLRQNVASFLTTKDLQVDWRAVLIGSSP